MGKKQTKEKFKTSIGGQALIEGIMMRGPSQLAIAVRDPAGQIQIETEPVRRNLDGYRALMRSAEISMTEEEREAEESKFDRWMQAHLGEKGMNAMMAASAFLGGLDNAFAFFAISLGELHNQNGIFSGQANQHNQPQLGIYTQRQAHEVQTYQCA